MATPAPVASTQVADNSAFGGPTAAQAAAANAALGSTPAAPPATSNVPTSAPSGQTSTSSAQATPTTVVSSQPAAAAVTQMQGTMTQAQIDLANQQSVIAANKANENAGLTPTGSGASSTFVNPATTSAAAATTPTPEETIANTPDTGNQWLYDVNGNRVQNPIGSPIPAGYSTTNPTVAPNTPTVATATDPLGNTYVQYSDGTYGKINAAGVYVGTAQQSDFTQAQQGQSLLTSMAQVANGTYPLTANQQAQVNGITAQFQQLITAQTQANANLTGGTTIAENLYGMGTSLVGLGQIKGTVDSGLAKIGALNSQMAAAVAQMEDSFQTNDMTMMKDAYDTYEQATKDRQSEIDTIQAAAEKSLVDAQTAQRDNETISLQKMVDDNTVSQDALNYKLAQSTLDEKTKADLASEKTAQEVAEKGTYQVKTNPDGTQSIFNTATGKVVGGGVVAGGGTVTIKGQQLVSGTGQNLALNSQFPEVNAAFVTSSFGVPYIDTSNLSAAGKLQAAEVAQEYQQENGHPLPMVTAKNATVVQNIDDAKSNLDDMTSIITSNNLASSNFLTKPFNSALIKVEGATQANADVASLNSYALSAISLAKTMGAQGRLNQQEIQLATNSLPSADDTVETVQTKLTNLSKILGNAQSSILGASAFDAANPTPASKAISSFMQSNGSSQTTGAANFSSLDSQFGL